MAELPKDEPLVCSASVFLERRLIWKKSRVLGFFLNRELLENKEVFIDHSGICNYFGRGLAEGGKNMMASQLMHRDIVTIKPMESIITVAKKMRQNHADMVVVLEDDGRVRGVLTEKEVIMAAMNSVDAEQAADDSAKREHLIDFASDDENRCNYFSEVATDLLMGGLNSVDAEQAADDSAKREHLIDFASDDENRCNYFSEVAIDLLMGG